MKRIVPTMATSSARKCFASLTAAHTQRFMPQSSRRCASSSALPLPLILQHFLQAMTDGQGDRMEPFLHHNFVYEQMPVVGCPKGSTLYKFDFLKRTPEARSAFASRVIEVVRMLEQGAVVVIESKTVSVAAIDMGNVMKKGQSMTVFTTSWFEFDPQTKTITKLKSYDCPMPVEDPKK